MKYKRITISNKLLELKDFDLGAFLLFSMRGKKWISTEYGEFHGNVLFELSYK